jgi:putative ABC transport system substrate-binding protein
MSVAADTSVAILYPETSEPIKTVFDEIKRGIEDAAGNASIAQFQITDQTDGSRLRQFLNRTNPAAVITLGRTPHNLYQSNRDRHPPPVVGALDATPDTHPQTRGIGISVDPDLLFQRLKLVSPNTQRVLVVYDPRRDTATMARAREAAARHGLRLMRYEATNLRESTLHFTNFFRYANPATDAIWLTLDANLINETANLPVIIKESWSHRMVVFSNNLAHVDKGVLFAMYPDPYPLGQRLFSISQEPVRGDQQIRPLQDAKSALNKRMANHLNLKLPAAVRRTFDMQLEGR